VATIATYDAVTGCPAACAIPQTAHKLSANQSVVFTIATSQDNQINATLDGIPASAILVPGIGATLAGNPSGFTLGRCNSPVQPVNVIALDADQNYILGAGAPTPSLASNDETDLPVTATPSPSSPNRFTLTPRAMVTASKTIGAAPLAGSGTLPVTAHVNVTFGTSICGVYVADLRNNAVKEILAVGNGFPASPTIETLGSGFTLPQGVAVDCFGNVFVAENAGVKEILAVDGRIPATPTSGRSARDSACRAALRWMRPATSTSPIRRTMR
jgi:hypothetical protein